MICVNITLEVYDKFIIRKAFESVIECDLIKRIWNGFESFICEKNSF